MRSPIPIGDRSRANLFAFPAQSNFSGVKHPLSLIDAAHDRGWHVLLDAAAFVPTSNLDLRIVSPDFVAISFYKMFGYPTGVGCLLIRNTALATLIRPWFAGGTVNFATVQGRLHVLAPREARFEDGTLNYLNIPAVEIGLRHLESIGMDTIPTRVGCLTDWLVTELLALRHSNGRPMVRLYGPASMTIAWRHGADETVPAGACRHRRVAPRFTTNRDRIARSPIGLWPSLRPCIANAVLGRHPRRESANLEPGQYAEQLVRAHFFNHE